MKPLLRWIAVPLLLLGAAMLIEGIGASSLSIAVTAVGTALVVIGQVKPNAVGQHERASPLSRPAVPPRQIDPICAPHLISAAGPATIQIAGRRAGRWLRSVSRDHIGWPIRQVCLA